MNRSLLLLLLSLLHLANAQNPTIETVVGAKQFNNVPLAEAPVPVSLLHWPIAVDAQGNVYVSERSAIRKFNVTTGVSTIFVGGRAGFSGDGGPADQASVYDPFGLTFDSRGDLYFADRSNQRIRKVDATTGIISTVAGSGPAGLGSNVSAGDGGLATQARLNSPSRVAIATDGTLYIATYVTQYMRVVSAQDNRIQTFPVYGPADIETHPSGDLLVSSGRSVVRRNRTTGAETLLIGGFSAASVCSEGMRGVDCGIALSNIALDAEGTLWVSDGRLIGVGSDGRIRNVHSSGIGEIAVDPQGDVIFTRNGGIYRYNPRTREEKYIGGVRTSIRDGVPASASSIHAVAGTAVDTEGNLFFDDLANGQRIVRMVSAKTGTVDTMREPDGTPMTGAIYPGARSSVFLARGKTAYRWDPQMQRFLIVNSLPADVNIGYITSDYAGTVYLGVDRSIDRVDANGTQITRIYVGARGNEPFAVDREGYIYISKYDDLNAFQYGRQGYYLARYDPRTRSETNFLGKLFFGYGPVAVDEADNLYWAQWEQTRLGQIVRIDATTREITKVAGTGVPGWSGDGGDALQATVGSILRAVAFDTQGRLYFADGDNNVIRRVNLKPPARLPRLISKTPVNAASLVAGATAPSTWTSLFGAFLAPSTIVGSGTPLPVTLGGTRVRVTDSASVTRDAPLQFVSEGQINFMVPEQTALGQGSITVETADGLTSPIPIDVRAVAPGLFSISSTGKGVAAAFAIRVRFGTQTVGPIFEWREQTREFIFVPIPVVPDYDQVYLQLFGTGLRGASSPDNVRVKIAGVDVPVIFAGAQGEFAGLDQLNIGPLPSALAEPDGVKDIEVTIDGVKANTVQVGLF